MISQYWVGDKPSSPITFSIRNSNGQQMNCTGYTHVYARMKGSDNEEVDLTGSVLEDVGAVNGYFQFNFPTDRSLFNKSGDYMLQLIFETETSRDITSPQVLRVRELGKAGR